MKKVLVTGATGFVGRELLKTLGKSEYDIVSFQRGDIQAHPNLFQNFDYVIHLAGKAHDKGATWEDFDRDNIRLTADLLEKIKSQSPNAKFIFISSAKVYGENSNGAFSETSPTAPQTPYGKSKLLAEDLVKKSQLLYIIFRPTLIFSENAKGNLQALRKISKWGIPLPSNIKNQRSLARLSFVVEKIKSALEEKMGWNEIYNLCDLNLSTTEIFRLNGVDFLLPYPRFIFQLLPKSLKQKLIWNLELDNSKILGR